MAEDVSFAEILLQEEDRIIREHLSDHFQSILRQMQDRIREQPESSSGEVIVHKDGSVTENRWTARKV